jgi:DNA repair protein RadC
LKESALPEAQQTALASARERLDSVGASALSDAELLTILLAPYTGSSRIGSAVDRLAASSLSEIARASLDELVSHHDLGPAGAAALRSAFELGRRGANPLPRRGDPILSPQRVFELMRHLTLLDHEEFHVVLSDARGRLMKTALIATGSLTCVAVSPADVFREVLRASAVGVIFTHCHPSGDPSPSQDDLEITHRLAGAAKILNVKAHDHVVVAAGGYYSFAEAGRL